MNKSNASILFEYSVGARQTHPTDVFEQVKARFFTDLDTLRRADMDGWNLHWYQHLLNLYLQRTLSYDRDIISASTGVAKLISRAVEKKEGEGRTCWTVPRRQFLGGLTWAPTKGCKEVVYRAEKMGGAGVLEDGRKIPSWHWASVVMGDSVAFVQGSEPGQLYKGLRHTWTTEWTEEEWEELEKTGRVEFRGGVVDFDHEDEGWQEVAAKDAKRREQGVSGGSREDAVQLLRATESPALSTSTEELVDNDQCALKAWRERRGSFISCNAWVWAGTMDEVKEPLAIYPFAHRLGNPKPMQPNRHFVLMVEWDEETRRLMTDETKAGRVCRRAGWAMVNLKEWQAREPVADRFWLA